MTSSKGKKYNTQEGFKLTLCLMHPFEWLCFLNYVILNLLHGQEGFKFFLNLPFHGSSTLYLPVQL